VDFAGADRKYDSGGTKVLVWFLAIVAGIAAFIAGAVENDRTATCIIYGVTAMIGVFIICAANTIFTISGTLKDIRRMVRRKISES